VGFCETKCAPLLFKTLSILVEKLSMPLLVWLQIFSSTHGTSWSISSTSCVSLMVHTSKFCAKWQKYSIS
jgi:hypothetical protein